MPQPRLPARRPSRDETLATRAHLRLRRPERPGRAPGRCVRLPSPRKVPTAPLESGPGPERRPERRRRRRRREQPTSGAAHPELLPGPLPPTPASRDVAALPARRPPRRGIPPPGQVVPLGSCGSPCSRPAGTSSGWMLNAWPCLSLRLKGGLGPCPGIPAPEECTS
ncbi:serine/arginine repetitive matrix protein 3-like [Phodopus roborovskii]|uniref:serine/arginine repetitive matrix protein 3-like n=1 Tax=Phodopus roborovskii TaxID=109678 RepID=UPI0021E49858|nr:serine/arginine repetitive matrix protein 3-like [Phodopus roborovskii]